MKRFSKNSIYAAGAGIAFMFLVTSYFFSTASAPALEADDVPGEQQVQEAGRRGATIVTKLVAKKQVVLQGVELCPGNGILSSEAAEYDRECSANVCATVIDFNSQPIPAKMTINRLYNGACAEQPFETARFVQIRGYVGSVAIPYSLGKRLRLSENMMWTPVKTEQSRFTEARGFGVNQSGKITLRYSAPVTEDAFLLDGKLIRVTYAL